MSAKNVTMNKKNISDNHLKTIYCISSKIYANCAILGTQYDLVHEISILSDIIIDIVIDRDKLEPSMDYLDMTSIVGSLDLEETNIRLQNLIAQRKGKNG